MLRATVSCPKCGGKLEYNFKTKQFICENCKYKVITV